MSTTTAPKSYTIAIVGGGIAGLALAIGFHRQGIPFHIYESAHAFGEIGAGVAFGPNSLRAMQLLDPRVREGFEKIATRNSDQKVMETFMRYRLGCEWRGEREGAVDGVGERGEVEAKVDGEGKEGEGNESERAWKVGHNIAHIKFTGANLEVGQGAVHRARFLDELVALVPEGNVSFNHRVVAIDDLGSEGVRLHFQHGETATADAVVGCDGVKSRVRPILLGEDNPAAHPSFTGKYAYRGLIPMDKAAALLGDDLARNAMIYDGYHGHVLTVPIENGKTMNVVAFKRKQDGKWEDENWVLPMEKEEMRKDFEGWGQNVKDIVNLMEKPDVWALFDQPSAETYFKGRICLLGDAAHASTPHQGAGAGMALEDALVLSHLLGQVDDGNNLEKAFQAYDETRRLRTQKLVTTSREAGEMYDLEGAGIGDDLDKFRANMNVRMNWIWDEDLEEELGNARNILARGLPGEDVNGAKADWLPVVAN